MEKELLQQLYSLSDAIERQQAVAVIGAGVSACIPKDRKKKYLKLPTGNKLVEEFSKSRNYIKESDSLPEAAFAIKQREGRASLIKLIQESFNNKFKPLPAHHVLAKLPFNAYISFNFDELLERALEDAGRTPQIIIKDIDVTMSRSGSVAVIKPHGSLSRAETIKIASDETIDLNIDSPLIVDLINVTIAQRKLIYIGFSLRDPDFIRMHLNVVGKLGDYKPRATAVVLSATDYERSYWREQGVEIIEIDLLDFLQNLTAIKTVGDDTEFSSIHVLESDPWLQDPFFQSLLAIRSLPTETQVIEAMLERVEDESFSVDPTEMVDRLKKAISEVLRYRPNYAAFGKVGENLVDMFEEAKDRLELQELMRSFRRKRQQFGEALAYDASKLIDKDDNIYLFSQSKRVIESIRVAVPAVQETCTIYISECRPKSPTSFQDAYAIYEELQDTQYKIRLIPDAAFSHLVDRGRVNKVFMGAHQLCEIRGKIEYFVNTCGSLAITKICALYNIPVIVIAETDKIEKFDSTTGLEDISRLPEENLSKAVISELSRIRHVATGVRIHNFGYDVCQVTSTVLLVINK